MLSLKNKKYFYLFVGTIGFQLFVLIRTNLLKMYSIITEHKLKLSEISIHNQNTIQEGSNTPVLSWFYPPLLSNSKEKHKTFNTT